MNPSTVREPICTDGLTARTDSVMTFSSGRPYVWGQPYDFRSLLVSGRSFCSFCSMYCLTKSISTSFIFFPFNAQIALNRSRSVREGNVTFKVGTGSVVFRSVTGISNAITLYIPDYPLKPVFCLMG